MTVIRMYSDFEQERKQNINQLKALIDKYLPIEQRKEAIKKIKAEQ